MAADPVLHVIDSYYFEVPKFMWHYSSKEQVPQWLRDKNPTFTDEQFAQELDGKILIPQPFGGKLHDLYTPDYSAETGGGFAISRHMIIELVVAILIIVLFTKLAGRVRAGSAPKGRLWNLLETFLVFLRDTVIRPSIDGDHADHADESQGHDAHGHSAHGHGHSGHGHAIAVHRRESDKFLPILWTMFFFVLFCNLFGILPWLGSPTGSLATTAALAGCTLLTGFIFGTQKMGVLGYWKNQIPSMDLPLAIAIILKPMIFLIEVAGLFIKHGILAVRLLANMVAGHLVIGGIMGLIVAAAASGNFGYWLTTIIAVIGTTLFFMLELFVAFLQAYIFTFLSSLFIGAAMHHH